MWYQINHILHSSVNCIWSNHQRLFRLFPALQFLQKLPNHDLRNWLKMKISREKTKFWNHGFDNPIYQIYWTSFVCHPFLVTLGHYWGVRLAVWANILPNSGQNYQIHVTDDCHIVLMRNLLPPPPVLFRYLCRISVCISPCFPFTVHPPTHSLQDILEDKPQICCDQSLSSNRWKCDLKSWLVEANFASNDWFGWDAQVSKSGIDLEKCARP